MLDVRRCHYGYCVLSRLPMFNRRIGIQTVSSDPQLGATRHNNIIIVARHFQTARDGAYASEFNKHGFSSIASLRNCTEEHAFTYISQYNLRRQLNVHCL